MLDQRLQFIAAWDRGGETMSGLCLRFGISRRTGYKWLTRYITGQLDGLKDRSRAPHRHPNAMPEWMADEVIVLRLTYPRWGPRKLVHRLAETDPEIAWPAASTAGDLLKRLGLVLPRHTRRRTPPGSRPFAATAAPNATWCADFKGWFRTGDGQRCDPFTLSDAYTRFLLRCQVVPRPTRDWVQPICDDAFREYGLPLAIRTDNGPPFATPSLGGLSRLSIHWIKLGIRPERITPGRPQQNGRHERLHRTLGDDAITPPEADAIGQQDAFHRFRQQYNEERPHEALGQRTPASVYAPSPRPFPTHPPDVTYPDTDVIRRVRHNGQIKWQGQTVYLCDRLIGELVGLRQTTDDQWDIHFGPVYLCTWNSRLHKLQQRTRNTQKTHDKR